MFIFLGALVILSQAHYFLILNLNLIFVFPLTQRAVLWSFGETILYYTQIWIFKVQKLHKELQNNKQTSLKKPKFQQKVLPLLFDLRPNKGHGLQGGETPNNGTSFSFGWGREIKTYSKEIWISLVSRRSSDWKFISHVRVELQYTHLMSQQFLIARVDNNWKSWSERKGVVCHVTWRDEVNHF